MPLTHDSPSVIVVDDKDKVSLEMLLLGNKHIVRTDCEGNEVVVHGITANDFVVKMLDLTTTPLLTFIAENAGQTNVASTQITRADGSIVTIQQVADAVAFVHTF